MTLRARIALLVGLAVAIAVAVVSVAAYALARDGARREVDQFLARRGAAVVFAQILDLDEINRRFPGRGPARDIVLGSGRVIEEDVVVQFVLPDVVITVSEAAVVLPVEPIDREVATAERGDLLRDVTVDGNHYRMLTRRVAPRAAMQVARDLSETDAILARLRTELMLLGLGGVVIAAGAGWWVARRSMRPVGDLTLAAERVAATHDLTASIPVDRDDEIGRLAASFNAMLAALEEARAGQQRLVADASHELRTPLTSLRTNIELVARGAIPEGELSGVLDDAKTELIELTNIVDELVDLATVGRHDEPKQRSDLAEIVHRVVERAQRRSGATITTSLEPTQIEMRIDGMTRAVSNLVDNALKWGGENGPVEIELRGRRLTVRDHGPGIDPGDRPRVFDRFYRASSARTKPGSGLGLSIVAAVVEDHGGTVFAGAPEGGGAEVGFTL